MTTTTKTEFVSLAPTADGYRHMQKMFSQTAKTSTLVVKHAEKFIYKWETLSEADRLSRLGITDADIELIHDALGALLEREQARIASMQQGIEECNASLEKKP